MIDDLIIDVAVASSAHCFNIEFNAQTIR